VSGGSAPEAGVWESARLGLVNVHQNKCWECRHRSGGEQDRSTRQSGEYACCARPRQSSWKPGWWVSGPGAAEHFVLPESTYGAILGDLDESIQVTSRYSQFLEVVRVLVDVVGALEVRVELELGKGLVLLVLLYKSEAELGLELGPGGEREQDGR
jgi:hypothetical protein